MSFFYLGNRVTPNIRVGSCSTRRLDDGGGGGGCLEFRKGSSDFPKRQLGISDVECPANDTGLADSTSTRLKRGTSRS